MDITPKTPWKERRIKAGTIADRKLSADILKIRRAHGSNIREIEKRTEYSAFMVAVCLLGALVLMVVFCRVSHAETIEGYDINTWAEAIHHAEGNDNYGILAHYKHTTYKQACINTIRHKHRLWVKSGHPGTFVAFLGSKYCPVGCSNDNGTNQYWIDNVKYWLYRIRKE